ncbi:MAG: Lrp/AsnC family transcriptional regulator [Candidatus Thermoplasmatota archaeon]
MARKSREEIRKDELEVLKKLSEDAKQSPNEISNKCGFSRQKAWRIIKKLENTKEIWGYTTITDEEKSDQNIYITMIQGKTPDKKFVEKMSEDLKEKKPKKDLDVDIVEIFLLHGGFDWLIMYTAKDIRHARKFSGYLEKKYGEIFEKIELLEEIFPLIKAGKVNPRLDKIKQFSIK